MSKRFALLVGMTAYPDDRLATTATNHEIRSLVERLRDPENGRFDRVVPLLNQTAVELQLGIASFFEQAMEPEDLVLIYFAGQALIHHHHIYLATADTFTEEYLDATTVEIDFIRRRLNGNQAQQIVLLDCNFSLLGATDRHTAGLEVLVNAFRADKRAVLAAHLLTATILDGLDGAADIDQDGEICFAELGTYVNQQRADDDQNVFASNERLDKIPVVYTSPGTAAVPVVPPAAATAGQPGASARTRRIGILAVILLLLLTVFGFYAVSSGLFSGTGITTTQADPTATEAADVILANASETPAPTVEATDTAEPTPTIAATKTAVATATTTVENTPTATPEATETIAETETPDTTSTATQEPTETSTPTETPSDTPTAEAADTPDPDTDGIPMEIVAQQAFLRAGPGINYRILEFPTRGTAVTVIAKNGDGTWFNVLLDDNSSGWLHYEVLEADEPNAVDSIPAAATIPVPIDEFYDPILTPSGDSLSVQVYHTYVGTQGDTARFEARLLPETNLIAPTYLSGQELGIGLLIVQFDRIAEGEYVSEEVELCMVSGFGTPFYCETYPAPKSW